MGADIVRDSYLFDDDFIFRYWLQMNLIRYKDLTVFDPFKDIRISTVIHNFPKYKLYIGKDRQIWRKA